MIAALRRRLDLLATVFENRLTRRQRTFLGIPVTADRTREQGWDEIFAAMEKALALLAAHHPVWIGRIRRDVAEIRVFRHPPCRGAFDPASRVIILDSYFVCTFPTTAVASSLVHEATHARIAAAAPHMRYSDDRAKHERICRRSEVRFARRLPYSAASDILARAGGALRGGDEEVAPPLDAAVAARIGRPDVRGPTA